MEFRVLGPVEVVVGGQCLALRGQKQRTLLAALVLQANKIVATERLIDVLWGEQPPETARAALQVHVSQLRKLLGRDRIVTHPRGYLLRVETDELDLERFERLVGEARGAAGSAATVKLCQALALWRGPPLAGFEQQPFAFEEISRLEELKLRAEEQRIDADLALGRQLHLLPELEVLVRTHPYREHLCGQLMLALYRSGRQAEALDAYRSTRERLVDGLGIEPGPGLRRLERAILDQDPELDAWTRGERPVVAATRLRPSLAARSTSFVGREKELREIRALLERPAVRLLSLIGPAGTGKTRLALETVGGNAERDPVFVEIAAIVEPGLVASAIASTLGLSETSPQRAIEALIVHLRGRPPTLLIIDNLEQVLDAGPVLAQLLAAVPGTQLLVTSRAPLDLPEERIYAVPPLQLAPVSRPFEIARLRETEAIRLFVERAREARPDFELSDENAEAVAELCGRLDGLPLGLELAAARIKLLPPRAILERLNGRLELLKAAPGAGLPKRHRTLRAAVDWSYDLLTTDEQALFTSLGVFVGGFSLEGAAGVADDLDVDVVDGLEALLNNSLLRTERMSEGEPRFGMLETMREYALERLAERGDGEAVRRRHAHFFLRLAEEAEPALLGPQQGRWLQRLDSERGNLRAALAWATENGEAEVGLRTAGALWRFWQMRAADAEGREHLDRLLASGSGSASARAFGQSRAASLALYQGDYSAVRHNLEASLPVHRKLGDDWNLSAGLQLLTMTLLAEGDANQARAVAEEALEASRRTQNATSQAYALANLGVVLAVHGQLDDAQRLIEESMRRARELGNLRSVANWTKALGGIAVLRTDYAQARELFEQSLTIYRDLDDPWGTLGSLSGLALVALEEHDNKSARRLLDENLELLRKSGHHFRVANSLEIAARLAAGQNRDRHAVRLYAAAGAFRGAMTAGMFECEAWPDPAPHIAHLRSALGERAFAETWAQGKAMTLDQSLTYALAEDDTERA